MEALIFDGKVVQIEAQEFPVSPALSWVDINSVTPRPKVGWTYNGVVFTAPPPVLAPPKPTDADRAEASIRSNPGNLAIWRAISGNNALTEDAAVALSRAKLP